MVMDVPVWKHFRVAGHFFETLRIQSLAAFVNTGVKCNERILHLYVDND
jgi:hypothetical protein